MHHVATRGFVQPSRYHRPRLRNVICTTVQSVARTFYPRKSDTPGILYLQKRGCVYAQLFHVQHSSFCSHDLFQMASSTWSGPFKQSQRFLHYGSGTVKSSLWKHTPPTPMEIPSSQSCSYGISIPRLKAVEHMFAKATRQWTSAEELEAKLHHARPGLGSAYSNRLVIMPDDCVAASTSLEGGFSERASQFGKIPVLMREGDFWRWNNQISRKLAHVLHSTL
jgi:hypothetical protein